VPAEQAAQSAVDENTPTIVIGVEGMMCHHCVAAVEKACLGVPGALTAKAELEARRVTVRGTAEQTALENAIVEAGYTIRA
jgi:copper chaperone CopZ